MRRARNWRDVRADALRSGHITEEGIAAARGRRRPRVMDQREPGCVCCAEADCANGRHCDGFAANHHCCACGLKTARYWLWWPWNKLEDTACSLREWAEERLRRA